MATMLLWVDCESEPILNALAEVNRKKKELNEVIEKFTRLVEQNAKTTPVSENTSVEKEE